MTEADRIRSEVENLAAALDTMRTLVREGSIVDLGGLDERIAAVSGAVAALPEPARGTLRQSILLLLGAISSLQEAIVAARDTLAEELKGSDRRQQATAAYGRGPLKTGRGGSSPA